MRWHRVDRDRGIVSPILSVDHGADAVTLPNRRDAADRHVVLYFSVFPAWVPGCDNLCAPYGAVRR